MFSTRLRGTSPHCLLATPPNPQPEDFSVLRKKRLGPVLGIKVTLPDEPGLLPCMVKVTSLQGGGRWPDATRKSIG